MWVKLDELAFIENPLNIAILLDGLRILLEEAKVIEWTGKLNHEKRWRVKSMPRNNNIYGLVFVEVLS